MAKHPEKALLKLTVSTILSLSVLTIAPQEAFTDDTCRLTPHFSLKNIAAQSLDPNTLQGQNTLLFFGATWCPNCDAALPILQRLAETFPTDTLRILFIAVRQDTAQLAEFFSDQPPPYEIMADETGIISRQYRIKRIPTCVFIDTTRTIRYIGRPDEEIIWSLLAGEYLTYPDPEQTTVRASDRFNHPSDITNTNLKRLIVELDERPWHSKTLSKTARKSQQAMFSNAIQQIGGRIIHNYGKLKKSIVVELPTEKVDKIRQLPRFKSFTQDRRVHALLEDSAYQIKADYAWDNAITGQGVNVCVVDTGIDYTHPDLLDRVLAQYNFVTNTEDAMDDFGHGTHCAGIIASRGPQYRGVSYDVALMSAKVLDHTGWGYASDVILGIDWCVQQEADIISLSLGEGLHTGTCDDDSIAQAVNDAFDAGVAVFCASGNDGTSDAMVSPACASKAIAVGAVDKIDTLASYSDGGAELDLVAPGGEEFVGGTDYPEIVSTYSTEVANNPFYCLYQLDEFCFDNYFVVDGMRYIRAVGTSMAAPHAAGAAALLLEENPHLTAAEIKSVLEQNADDLGVAGWDKYYGWGRINIQRALENAPPEPSELTVEITEPNSAAVLPAAQQFTLASLVDCFGGDGCGEVLARAQYCHGRDCNDFTDITTTGDLSTADDNPLSLGALSGYTIDSNAPVIFDAQTTFDISEGTYIKNSDPNNAVIGSTLLAQHSTGDLEPDDALGAIGQNVQKLYEFQIPAGPIETLKVRMSHYLVLNFIDPRAGWYIYTSNANGDYLHLVGDCIVDDGGGGEPPPPDCWFISEDPIVIADLNDGGTNYIMLASHDVQTDDFWDDWLTFNDIEVFVEYQTDPNNDEIRNYYVQFDLNDIDPSAELTSAHVNINISQQAPDATADVYLADNTLLPTDPAQQLHDVNDPSYSILSNPIKSFSCENPGPVSINVKAALAEALATDQTILALQIRENNNDQLFAIDAGNSPNPPTMTISQKILTPLQNNMRQLPPSKVGTLSEPNSEPGKLTYNTLVIKDASEDSYTKYDNPASAVIGSPIPSEHNTGDLEPADGLGAIGQNVEKLYQFQVPPGTVKTLSARMEHYLVLNFIDPRAGWYVYTSNAAGDNLHLVGDCIVEDGGGGEPPPPDCWFISDDPTVTADVNTGGISYIKLVSHDVQTDDFWDDWLTFNDIEVIIEYAMDPNNDSIHRYYATFDISALPPDAQIDSATLNLHVTQTAPDATGEISLVNNTYDANTGPYTIYNAEDADYSSLTNPIKTFAADTPGLKQINVKAGVEDAIESQTDQVAFLLTEQNADALFTIDANDGNTPPQLNIYLRSEISSAVAAWQIQPTTHGNFTLRILATNNIGITTVSDAIVVELFDANQPWINDINCIINSLPQPCSLLQYGDTLNSIIIDACDLHEIPDVNVVLRNVPDDHNFADARAVYDGNLFVYDTNLLISDSGQWQIIARCTNSEGNTDTETITWLVPWGSLLTRLVNPPTDINVPKSDSFTVVADAKCVAGECPDTNISLRLNQPLHLEHDDGTAEDYGDIGSTDGYLAVKFIPTEYPTGLRAARFYVWDQTTYPFELHVWDDDGPSGTPGTALMTPLLVDPVVPSMGVQDVAWFDVDLTQYDIDVDSGAFYIGWRQIQGNNNNQIGFDTEGPPRHRTWGYLPLLGWFNLDFYCDFDPNACGNIMIRAIVAGPGSYEGQLPTNPATAPFYTRNNHPHHCPDIKANQTCRAIFRVRAVGPVAEQATFDSVALNNYSVATAASIDVTIDPAQSPCHAANLDAFARVQFADFALLANKWLDTTTPLPADINNDGTINNLDLQIMAEYWLTKCN